MQSVLHVDDRTVADLVDEASADRAVADAFAAWGRGEAATTQRVRAAGRDAGLVSAMAAVVPPYCGGKLYATNAGRFTFVNVLFDVGGTLLATVDGDVVTARRTAAGSALAIRHLAAAHATVATVIGTGRQAGPHVAMLLRALPNLAEVRICGRNRDFAARLAAGVEGAAAIVHDDPADAVAGAHVVVTVTSAYEPLFPATAVADDALICAVGATKADRAEIEPELVARCAAVVCDDVTGSRVECGDLVRAAAAGRFDWADAVELNAIAAGTAEVPRAGDAPVLFETQGVAIQDVAVCGLAYARHVETQEVH
jgi:ornithine cyclodeaminase/alanine dehydrogenase-like protein (mu-crystallin family)